MDDLSNKPPVSTEPGLGGTPGTACQCQCLSKMITAILVLLIIVSGTLSAMLFRLSKYMRQDLLANRPVAEKILVDYAKEGQPEEQRIEQALKDFASKNKDFELIMNHYGITNSPGGK